MLWHEQVFVLFCQLLLISELPMVKGYVCHLIFVNPVVIHFQVLTSSELTNQQKTAAPESGCQELEQSIQSTEGEWLHS